MTVTRDQSSENRQSTGARLRTVTGPLGTFNNLGALCYGPAPIE